MVDQEQDVIVWCEAAGMVPQLAAVAEPYSVHVFSGSGFDSLTTKKRLADRVIGAGRSTIAAPAPSHA